LPERIFLIGMMGSGKTTTGRRLASRLGCRFLDSDDQVCANTGRTVREIFETDGEAAFRAEEKKALAAAAAASDPVVVAVAGGAVLDEDNRRLLRASGEIVWLRAPTSLLADRVRAGIDHRPLLGDDPATALDRLDVARQPIYEALADVTVDVDGRTPAEVVDAILERIDRG
jgi:shikimate kinase